MPVWQVQISAPVRRHAQERVPKDQAEVRTDLWTSLRLASHTAYFSDPFALKWRNRETTGFATANKPPIGPSATALTNNRTSKQPSNSFRII